MPKPIFDGNEELRDIHFPKAGLNVACPFSKQPNLSLPVDGTYARTTPIGINVRTFEPTQNRSRGGSRPGLTKYIPTQPGGVTWISQLLDTIVTTGGTPMQLSQSGREVILVTVSQGQVYYVLAGGSSWTLATNSTGNNPPLNFSGLVYSAVNNLRMYFADGINYALFDPSSSSVLPWTASAGLLPVDSQNNTPRLICTWRGRTVLSGLLNDPQNWFMSAVADPTNWDYSPVSASPTQAVAGNNSPLGLIGDVVTTLIPYTDDVLVCGGDHTIWLIAGDPMAGGQIQLVSDAIGMAWGIPWCKDSYGSIYFVSNKTGIYTLVPGQAPQRISQPIEYLLQNIDTGSNGIRLVWNDWAQGLNVFITPLSAPASTTHFFWEMRSNSWWEDQFANSSMNPLAVCTFDGNSPDDRTVLVGGWDGYVRQVDPNATSDDGTAISSSVFIGPLLTPNFDEILLKDLQCLLGASSGSVSYSVYTGPTAEIALTRTPVATGSWSAGRNLLSFVRRAGHAVYVQISSTNAWQLEAIRCRIASQGKVRMRGK